MTREQKHKISQQIVESINRITFYQNAIKKIQVDKKLFYSGEIQIRVVGVKTIWEELTVDEVTTLLRRKLKDQHIKLAKLEKQIH